LTENHESNTSNVAKELSDMIVYCQSTAGGITQMSIRNKKMNYQRMSSTTDNKVLKEFEKFENKYELIEYHQNILSRIYPKLSNLQSANFNPIPYWNVGVQIAALNIQTPGRNLRINDAMFQQNGNSGYIVKTCLKKVIN
jgi:hypothetical protein